MNSFIHQSNDKFSATKTVYTSEAGESWGSSISLRYHSSENGDAILIDLQYSDSGDQPHIDQGNLFLLINGTKRYSFVPHLNRPASAKECWSQFLGEYEYYTCWKEYVYYKISKDILREMAFASSVEFKVTGASVASEIKEDGERPSFIIIAKALYNAIFDNSAFIEDLEKEKQRLEGAKVEAELIKQEWKELQEKCEQHNSHMRWFIGWGVSWDTTEEKFMEEFGENPTELSNHLEFAIPLFESLLNHMHEYNEKYPKTKIEINYVKEEKVRKFVEVLKLLKQCPDRAKHLEGAKVEAELIKQEWKELQEKCKKHNSHMGQFIGRGCSWDTTEEKFIESFGENSVVLYTHLEFAIPLFESLLNHMHEYNEKYPKTKIEINYVKEEKVRKFVEVLKQCRDRAKRKSINAVIAVVIFVIIIICMLFIL